MLGHSYRRVCKKGMIIKICCVIRAPGTVNLTNKYVFVCSFQHSVLDLEWLSLHVNADPAFQFILDSELDPVVVPWYIKYFEVFL